MLRFFFADALDHEERLALVDAIRAQHEGLRAELTELLPVVEALRPEDESQLGLLTLETGIAYQDALRRALRPPRAAT